jgi:phytoene desaturase
MAEKSIVIIGAGLAGLSAGCYAQMNGYRSHIFEQHTQPGGVCTAWKRHGYTMDGCIHWLMGCNPDSFFHRVYREVGALEGNRLIVLDHYARIMVEGGSKSLDLTSDLDGLEADMKALAPEDAAIIDEIIAGVRAVRGLELAPEKPRQLMGFFDNVKLMWKLRRAIRYVKRYNMSVISFAQRINNPFLRWAITNTFVPEMPMLFLFWLLAELAEGQLGTVEGGSLAFATSIARRYAALGGETTVGASVEEILVENDRAVGVRLADGTEHRADVVISAADGHSTIFAMLGGRYVDEEIRNRYDKWPLFRPLVMVSFGVAGQFPAKPAEHMVRLDTPFAIGTDLVDAMGFRIFDYDPTLAPTGKTVVQVMAETNFDYWDELRQDRAAYEAEKERVAGEVLQRLEWYLPGISSQVEVTDVATPYTLWRYTRNHRGAYEGWLMTPDMLRVQVPKTLPGLDSFYMAGQWVEPGGGVPAVIPSGRQVIQLLCHHDGKRFVTSVP